MAFLALSSLSFADGADYRDYKALLIGDVNGNIIKEFKRPHVAPAEMEKISLTKKQIESVSTDKMIISMKKGVE